ncbi:uncharacterized protein EV422DRAFT_564753 [Fimicolochytrium jonesii]|uniref:uncharacterized protein n=1 Tax=Fimicolochytrium jonesii TaxID=1396493 RepID=UPI0022FE8F31|nr:uncharacterized protein EV422DRAFT_564753 [Fimicolochytrium jonesii]KAI8824047.1 hypothetical protein EV422DRAFT_564753 [Fimicolochytrium jonesii]
MSAQLSTSPSPPTPLLRRTSTSSTSPIIYEVNLSVPAALATGYADYLTEFTRGICSEVHGFTGVQIFTQPKPVGLHWLSEEGGAKAYFTVHYHVASQMDLDTYLATHQQRVSEADKERWQHLVTSRRILRLFHSSIGE